MTWRQLFWFVVGLCTVGVSVSIGWSAGVRRMERPMCRESVTAMEVDGLEAACPPGSTLHIAPAGNVAVVACQCPAYRPLELPTPVQTEIR